MRKRSCNGQAVLLAACVLLVAAQTVPAVQVKLSNGTVLNGDIVDQNENFIVVQVGQAKLSIAKNMVVEIAGRPASVSAAPAWATPAPSVAVSGYSQGKNVEVTLTNGSKFKGAIAAMDNRVIEIETADKSRLVFYKINIADVRDLQDLSAAAAPVPPAAAASQASPAPAAARPSAPAEATPGKTVEITLKSGAKFSGTVIEADQRHVSLEVAKGSKLDFFRNVIVDIRDLSAPGSPAANSHVSSTPAAGTPAAPVKTAAAAAVPTGPPGEAVPGKMVEITLKSGAKFKGLVNSADERHIVLEVSRGSSLDFYRNVIVGITNLETPPVSAGQVISSPAPVPVVTAPALQPQVSLSNPSAVSAPVKPAIAPAVPVSVPPPAPVPVVTAPALQPQVSLPTPSAVSAPVKPAIAPAVPVSLPPPALPVVPAVQPKGPEGRNELKLKNGTVFSGNIVSANDWYITFSVSGMTVNVLRRCIVSVDGTANADTVMPARGTFAGAAPPEKAEMAAGLAKAISDSSGEARKNAVTALGAMGDTIAVLPLVAALRDNDPGVRKAAAEALGDLRDPRAVLPLCSALQDPVDSARAAIQFSLKLHSEIPLLIGALDNQNTLVRDNAAYLLWLLTGKNFGNDKQGWVDWYSAGR